MQTPPSQKWPSSEMRIKDAQCLQKNDGCKKSYLLISCLGTAGVQKGAFWAPKNSTFFKSDQNCKVD